MRRSLFVSELHHRFPDEEVELFPVDTESFSFGGPGLPVSSRDASREDFRNQHLNSISGTAVTQKNAQRN